MRNRNSLQPKGTYAAAGQNDHQDCHLFFFRLKILNNIQKTYLLKKWRRIAIRIVTPPTQMYPIPDPKSHVESGGSPGVFATYVLFPT